MLPADAQCSLLVAAEAAGIGGLPNHQQWQLLPSSTAGDQDGEALLGYLDAHAVFRNVGHGPLWQGAEIQARLVSVEDVLQVVASGDGGESLGPVLHDSGVNLRSLKK